ncbi:hypothetical protein KIH07_03005 [Hydrogenophaga taeniospiralis]|uniref:hypothetical protein n=1 Tax=Hydrogenophaga taeniospiralis TaxID=65656 RepID=UPI001CF97CBA|nr:hypothetical protein [Hydrogenophaga taeniospiralis]MCB4362685.1 hypothetical protein [Hydrogenophaga taeniospiralis]
MSDQSDQAANLSAILRARAALVAVWAWLKGKPVATSLSLVAALVLSMVVGQPIGWPFDPTTEQLAPQPAVTKADQVADNPITTLSARVDVLEDQVAELRDQMATLQEPQPTAAPQPGARRASGISQAHQPSPAPGSKRWGTTDLDREIEEFSQSISSLESAK